jgi:hypothetical protein
LEGCSASVRELAAASAVSFAAAHRELERMRAVGLALVEREGASTVYRANRRHPRGDLLVSLLEDPAADHEQDDAALRGSLAALGAPLQGAPSRGPQAAEDVLADGLALTHRSLAVAPALPIALWRQRDRLDYRHLRRAAARRDERQTLGFFLQLVGRLSGERRFVRRGSTLRDRRRTVKRPFFLDGTASDGSSPLALTWGFLLDIDGAGLTSAFRKHVPDRVIRSRSPR